MSDLDIDVEYTVEYDSEKPVNAEFKVTQLTQYIKNQVLSKNDDTFNPLKHMLMDTELQLSTKQEYLKLLNRFAKFMCVLPNVVADEYADEKVDTDYAMLVNDPKLTAVASHVDWTKVNADSINMLLMYFKEGAFSENATRPSLATVNSYLSAIKHIMNICYKHKKISTTDHHAISQIKFKRVKTNIVTGRVLSLDEQRTLMQRAENQDNEIKAIRDVAIIAVMLGAGLRREEVVSLRREHVLPDKLKVRGKGEKDRIISIDFWVYEALSKWLDKIAEAEILEHHVFYRIYKSGKISSRSTLTTTAINDLFVKLCVGCNFTAAPHDARRTFATELYRNGETLEKISIALGHSSVETTRIYIMRSEMTEGHMTKASPLI